MTEIAVRREKAMKKYMHRIISVVMCGVMTLSLVGCGVTNAKKTASEKISDAKQAIAEEQLQNFMEKSTGMMHSDGKPGKIETVYVNSDANGAAREIIVSDWLKNPNGDATISDESNLKDIVNVKGKQTYTMDEAGHIIWDAEGSDIYYQGYSDEKLPIDVNVSYTLDGKEERRRDDKI